MTVPSRTGPERTVIHYQMQIFGREDNDTRLCESRRADRPRLTPLSLVERVRPKPPRSLAMHLIYSANPLRPVQQDPARAQGCAAEVIALAKGMEESPPVIVSNPWQDSLGTRHRGKIFGHACYMIAKG